VLVNSEFNKIQGKMRLEVTGIILERKAHEKGFLNNHEKS